MTVSPDRLLENFDQARREMLDTALIGELLVNSGLFLPQEKAEEVVDAVSRASDEALTRVRSGLANEIDSIVYVDGVRCRVYVDQGDRKEPTDG